MRAHVRNTPELLEHFNKPSIAELKGKIPVSFNVVSLYSNIPVKETVDTALQYINKYNIDLHNLETIPIFKLVSLLLENNVFQYPGFGCYMQIRGLATGRRISGTRRFGNGSVQAQLYLQKLETTTINLCQVHR